MAGGGKYFVRGDRGTGVVRLWIFNFDVGSDILKEEHKNVLNEVIAEVVRGGGNVKLLGLASTTGKDDRNKKLSEDRCASVEKFLREKAGHRFILSKSLGVGEVMAKAFKEGKLKGGTDDNVEEEIWRGVVVNAWNRDLPPPPPINFDSPLESQSWVSDAGTLLDKAGLALTLVDAAADIFAIEVLAAVTGPLGLVLMRVALNRSHIRQL